ncbi:Uncharacterised protein [Mycobacteroides abscessus subsp. abscessus]|nr:Uncharacterised protein [Mycobacteroides abscessus subsp. abscessus]
MEGNECCLIIGKRYITELLFKAVFNGVSGLCIPIFCLILNIDVSIWASRPWNREKSPVKSAFSWADTCWMIFLTDCPIITLS